MKRRIVMLLVFLLLGAIVNIAVAWRCAIAHNRVTDQRQLPSREQEELWKRYAPDSFPQLPSSAGRGSVTYRFGETWRMAAFDPPAERSSYLVGRTEFGVPFRSLFGTVSIPGLVGGSADQQFSWYVLSPIPYSHMQFHSGRLPIGVIPLGFAINTLFYAAILWLLCTARLALPYARRRRRIKRGLCPACAYPVGASDLCTECGKPVMPSGVRPARS